MMLSRASSAHSVAPVISSRASPSCTEGGRCGRRVRCCGGVALAATLQPWFAGKRELSYKNFVAAAGVASSGPANNLHREELEHGRQRQESRIYCANAAARSAPTRTCATTPTWAGQRTLVAEGESSPRR